MARTIKGPTVTPIQDVYWARVILAPPPNATWQRNEDMPAAIVGMQTLHANVHEEHDTVAQRWHFKKTPFRLTLIGGVWVEYSTDEAEPFTGSISGTGTDATLTDVAELDSIVAVPAGAVPTLLVAANPTRSRGVTIANMGITTLYVGKSAALTQAGVAASIALPPGAAANDGTGGTVVFDGWRGPVYAINQAGGPGSALVSAY